MKTVLPTTGLFGLVAIIALSAFIFSKVMSVPEIVALHSSITGDERDLIILEARHADGSTMSIPEAKALIESDARYDLVPGVSIIKSPIEMDLRPEFGFLPSSF